MDRKTIINAVATVLIICVIVGAFTLYRQDAVKKEITIGFDEIIEFNLTEGSSSELKTLNPEQDTYTVNVILSKKSTKTDSNFDTVFGKFYLELVQDKSLVEGEKYLSDEIVISVITADNQVLPHSQMVKTGESEPLGYVSLLKEVSDQSFQIQCQLSDEVKDNFIEYAEQEVTLKLYWIKKEFDDLYYDCQLTIEIDNFTGNTYTYNIVEANVPLGCFESLTGTLKVIQGSNYLYTTKISSAVTKIEIINDGEDNLEIPLNITSTTLKIDKNGNQILD